MSKFFTSGGQSIGASVSAPVLPMKNCNESLKTFQGIGTRTWEPFGGCRTLRANEAHGHPRGILHLPGQEVFFRRHCYLKCNFTFLC